MDVVSDSAFDDWLAGLGFDWLSELGSDEEVDPAIRVRQEHEAAAGRGWLQRLYESEGPVDRQTAGTAIELRQLELVAWAVEVVRTDVERVTNLRPTLEVTTFEDDCIGVAYGASRSSVMALGIEPESVLAAVADNVQEHVIDDVGTWWPWCDTHRTGVTAELRRDEAVWWCRKGDHRVAAVGDLGVPRRELKRHRRDRLAPP
jgi:hypothetical protein